MKQAERALGFQVLDDAVADFLNKRKIDVIGGHSGPAQGVIEPGGIVVEHLIAADLESGAVADEGDHVRDEAGVGFGGGLWQAGRQTFSTADLVGILDAEPERISPSALLRPVFQDFLLSTSLTIGGPAEIAYFAQSAVLFERILGRVTPVQPRFTATLIEPAIGELLRKHELTLERVFTGNPASLAQWLAARAMPTEGKKKLAAAGTALDAELATLLDWMRSLDAGLGRSAETAASKMRYQMNRLRTLAANFQLQRESSLSRHADALCQALYPGGALQERLHGAAYYFARYGFELAEELTAQAANPCPGHMALWL